MTAKGSTRAVPATPRRSGPRGPAPEVRGRRTPAASAPAPACSSRRSAEMPVSMKLRRAAAAHGIDRGAPDRAEPLAHGGRQAVQRAGRPAKDAAQQLGTRPWRPRRHRSASPSPRRAPARPCLRAPARPCCRSPTSMTCPRGGSVRELAIRPARRAPRRACPRRNSRGPDAGVGARGRCAGRAHGRSSLRRAAARDPARRERRGGRRASPMRRPARRPGRRAARSGRADAGVESRAPRGVTPAVQRRPPRGRGCRAAVRPARRIFAGRLNASTGSKAFWARSDLAHERGDLQRTAVGVLERVGPDQGRDFPQLAVLLQQVRSPGPRAPSPVGAEPDPRKHGSRSRHTGCSSSPSRPPGSGAGGRARDRAPTARRHTRSDGLRDGLREVAARRRDGADEGHRAARARARPGTRTRPARS